MKISNVVPYLMSFALPKPLRLPFWGGERIIFKREAMLIKVTTDTGITGWAPGPAHERAAQEIRDVIRPFLLGQDPARWSEIEFKADLETLKTYRAVELGLARVSLHGEG